MKFILVYIKNSFGAKHTCIVDLDAKDIDAAKEESFVKVWLEDYGLKWGESNGVMNLSNLVNKLKKEGHWGKMISEIVCHIEEDSCYMDSAYVFGCNSFGRCEFVKIYCVVNEEVVTKESLNVLAKDARDEMIEGVHSLQKEHRRLQYERLKAEFDPPSQEANQNIN